jgi:hypothetical protein
MSKIFINLLNTNHEIQKGINVINHKTIEVNNLSKPIVCRFLIFLNNNNQVNIRNDSVDIKLLFKKKLNGTNWTEIFYMTTIKDFNEYDFIILYKKNALEFSFLTIYEEIKKIEEQEVQEDNCPICLDSFVNKTFISPCTHSFALDAFKNG